MKNTLRLRLAGLSLIAATSISGCQQEKKEKDGFELYFDARNERIRLCNEFYKNNKEQVEKEGQRRPEGFLQSAGFNFSYFDRTKGKTLDCYVREPRPRITPK